MPFGDFFKIGMPSTVGQPLVSKGNIVLLPEVLDSLLLNTTVESKNVDVFGQFTQEVWQLMF